MDVRTATGEKFVLERAINRGGEAQIWTVRQDPHLVAKLYHKPLAEHQTKLTAMIAAPLTRIGSHPTVAWPLHLLYRQNTFVGYLMPRAASSLPLFHYYNPARRRRLGLPHAWPRFLHRTASNLAAAVELVHAHDHVIGDLNESNVLVTQSALVTLVDTDSFQIRPGNLSPRPTNWLGTRQPQPIYRCPVGKAEYTPPELQGVDFKTIDRTPAQDNFALAVLIFYLLMEGYHPFAGVLTTGTSVGRVDLYGIRHGLFPYLPPSGTQLMVQPPPNAPAIAHLHPSLQDAFQRTFIDGHTAPERRVAAKEWKKLLQEAEEALVTCTQDKSHLYARHLRHCPTCGPAATPVPPVTPIAGPMFPQATTTLSTALPRFPGNWSTTVWTTAGQQLTQLVQQSKLALPPLTQTIQQVQPDWQSYAKQAQKVIVTLPDRLAHVQRTTVAHADLLGSWLVGNLVGMPVAALATVEGYALLPRLTEVAPLTIRQQAMFLVLLFATLLSVCQAYVLRRTLLPWPYLRYAWVGVAAMSGAAIGAAGFRLLGPAWDQVTAWSTQAYQLTLIAALFGLSLGFLQAWLLRQQVRRADDARAWTIVNGVNAILIVQGWLWGQSFPYTWQIAELADWQLNAGLGALAGVGMGALLSGSVLLWMIQGPRRTLYLHNFALNFLHWSVRPPRVRRGAIRWGRALLLLILVWFCLQLLTQLNGAAASSIPPLPDELIPHLLP